MHGERGQDAQRERHGQRAVAMDAVLRDCIAYRADEKRISPPCAEISLLIASHALLSRGARMGSVAHGQVMRD